MECYCSFYSNIPSVYRPIRDGHLRMFFADVSVRHLALYTSRLAISLLSLPAVLPLFSSACHISLPCYVLLAAAYPQAPLYCFSRFPFLETSVTISPLLLLLRSPGLRICPSSRVRTVLGTSLTILNLSSSLPPLRHFPYLKFEIEGALDQQTQKLSVSSTCT